MAYPRIFDHRVKEFRTPCSASFTRFWDPENLSRSVRKTTEHERNLFAKCKKVRKTAERLGSNAPTSHWNAVLEEMNSAAHSLEVRVEGSSTWNLAMQSMIKYRAQYDRLRRMTTSDLELLDRLEKDLEKFLSVVRSVTLAELTRLANQNNFEWRPIVYPIYRGLTGPGIFLYRRAVRRGYLGSPLRWLHQSNSARTLPNWMPLMSIVDIRSVLHVACSALPTRTQSSAVRNQFRNPKFGLVGRFTLKGEHARNKGKVLPLKPQLKNPSLPSYPTVYELWKSRYTGAVPCVIWKKPDKDFVRVSLNEVRKDPNLIRSIVTNQVIGIRSDIKIPKRYTWCFRYSENFLILLYPPPIALARFLLEQWLTNPYNLWLREKVLLRKFLRFVPTHCVEQNLIEKL